jgi:hypothetical protein
MVPSAAFQVTDLFVLVPLTVAVNCAVPPVANEVVAGETLTELMTGAATVMVAEADFVASALLVAVTVAVPAVAAAVYAPLVVIVPADAFQLTDLSLTVPATVAVNCCLPLVKIEAVVGEMLTEFTTGAETVTLDDADFVLSALLVAVTVSVPAFAGAV